MKRPLILVAAILVQSVAGCAFQGTQVWYRFSVDGPVRITEDVGYQIATGENGFLFHTRDDRPVTLSLRQVQEYQLVTIVVEVVQLDAGFRMNWFGSNEGEVIRRAIWVLSEPYRSNFELAVPSSLDPTELLLQVDRNDDGIFDIDLPPQIAVIGNDLDVAHISWGVNSTAKVEHGPADQATITLDYPRDIQGWHAGPVQEIIYAVYPDQPDLQTYEGPFTVNAGNTVRYRILFENGHLGILPEIPVR